MVIFFNIIYTFLGSIFEPCYIQNRVITNHIIKRLWCILSLMEIDHKKFSVVILSHVLIQEGQLSVSGERICTGTG